MDDIFLLTEVNRQFKIKIAQKFSLSGPEPDGQTIGFRRAGLTKDSTLVNFLEQRRADYGGRRGGVPLAMIHLVLTRNFASSSTRTDNLETADSNSSNFGTRTGLVRRGGLQTISKFLGFCYDICLHTGE